MSASLNRHLVSLVHTDGVLWYVAVCARRQRALRDIAAARGGMKVLDAGHVVLDPCLVSRD